VSGRLAAIAGLALAVLTSWLVHSYDQAQHDKVVADLRAAAAATLTKETNEVLARLQARIDQVKQLEEESARAAEERSRLVADGARLSADLAAAGRRLLDLSRSGRGGGGGSPSPGEAGTDGCADLRTALGRAAAALELYKSAGDQVAEDGQRGVDAATIAAQDAAAQEKEDGR